MDPHSAARELGIKRRLYAERLNGASFSVEGRDIPMARLPALASDAGKAAAVARSGAEWILYSYLGAQHRPVIERAFTPDEVDPVARYLDQVILHGTSARIVEEIQRLREEIGLDYLLCAAQPRNLYAADRGGAAAHRLSLLAEAARRAATRAAARI